ncbi:MAG: FAD-dependent monooxygenase [Candidatus Bipolaricaulota bacterium]|nr:FAD-dependent monooxygenase [Candidatus Bipolaricaulota bacterium]
MRLRINQISVKLDYEKRDVLATIARLLNCREEELDRLVLLRKSIDARGKDVPPRFVLSAEVDYLGEATPPFAPGRVDLAAPPEPMPVIPHVTPREHRPIVVGAGPAGLMAALTLAEAGWKPLLIERGADVQVRSNQVEIFWREGVLSLESNVLYGEGGAGLFSDGKLTARSKDRGAIHHLFQILVDCGASPDILIDAEPHLGSDVLSLKFRSI